MQAAERGAAANTLAAYRSDLTHFFAELEGRGKGPAFADSRDVAAYQRQLAQVGMAPSTRARRLSAVRQLFKFLAAEGIIGDDPAHRVAGPRRSRTLPKILSVAAVECLIESAARGGCAARARQRSGAGGHSGLRWAPTAH